MTLLIKPNAVSRLSQLTVDTDKDWNGKAITNLKGLAVGMTQGDLFFRGAAVIQRLAPGVAGQFLITRGSGANPEWGDYAGRAERLFYLAVNQPVLGLATLNSPGGGFTSAPNLITPAPGISVPIITSSPGLAVGGSVYHDDSPLIDTDETAQTNSVATNDMHLLPSPGAVGDGFYFGLTSLWDWLLISIGTAGAGVWTITWKYYNGVTWTALTLKYDETSHFRTSGVKRLHFIRPGDWALTPIAGLNLYWIKAEITAYTNMTTQPLGTQAWIGQY
jgi:hypothetical protein